MKATITLCGEIIGEVEEVDMEFTAVRDPPYWCPKCNRAVKGTLYGIEPNVKIVCARCGSPEIGSKEDMEFNPSKRYEDAED